MVMMVYLPTSFINFPTWPCLQPQMPTRGDSRTTCAGEGHRFGESDRSTARGGGMDGSMASGLWLMLLEAGCDQSTGLRMAEKGDPAESRGPDGREGHPGFSLPMGECDGNWVHGRAAISAAAKGDGGEGLEERMRGVFPESVGDKWPVVASVAHLPVIIPNTNSRWACREGAALK